MRYWKMALVCATAAFSLSGCFEIHMTAQVKNDGSTNLKMVMDMTKAIEMAKSLAKDDKSMANKFTCAEMTKSSPAKAGESCKDIKPGVVEISSTLDANTAKTRGLVVDGKSFKIDVVKFFKASGQTGDMGKMDDAQSLQMMKQMGAVMDFTVETPSGGDLINTAGSISKVDGKAASGSSVKVDLFEALAKPSYVVEGTLGGLNIILIGGAIGVVVVLLVVGGVMMSRKKKNSAAA